MGLTIQAWENISVRNRKKERKKERTNERKKEGKKERKGNIQKEKKLTKKISLFTFQPLIASGITNW